MSSTELERTAMDILLSAYELKILETMAKVMKPLSFEDLFGLTGFRAIDPRIFTDSLGQLLKAHTIEEVANDQYAVSSYGKKVHQRIANIARAVPRIEGDRFSGRTY